VSGEEPGLRVRASFDEDPEEVGMEACGWEVDAADGVAFFFSFWRRRRRTLRVFNSMRRAVGARV
jgi:hypothetical protein